MIAAMASGSRLAFVVRPIPGKVKRKVYSFEPELNVEGKIKGHKRIEKYKEQPGGYLVYFPMGHAIRIRDDVELKRLGLHRKPHIINLDGIHDPNSPVGQLIAAEDDDARRGAYTNLEESVIAIVKKRSGEVSVPKEA